VLNKEASMFNVGPPKEAQSNTQLAPLKKLSLKHEPRAFLADENDRE